MRSHSNAQPAGHLWVPRGLTHPVMCGIIRIGKSVWFGFPAPLPGPRGQNAHVDSRRSWIALLVTSLLTLSAATACTGPSAPPPTSAPPFVPAPPGIARFPAQVIDLANWYLTLPTGENK